MESPISVVEAALYLLVGISLVRFSSRLGRWMWVHVAQRDIKWQAYLMNVDVDSARILRGYY
jgi:hypothetical protein